MFVESNRFTMPLPLASASRQEIGCWANSAAHGTLEPRKISIGERVWVYRSPQLRRRECANVPWRVGPANKSNCHFCKIHPEHGQFSHGGLACFTRASSPPFKSEDGDCALCFLRTVNGHNCQMHNVAQCCYGLPILTEETCTTSQTQYQYAALQLGAP